MTATLIEGPEREPVSLIDMKTYLRVCDDSDDDLIASLITAARGAIETTTGRQMMRQTWRLVLDAWPLARILRVPIGPLLGLAAARIADATGGLQAVPPGYFVVGALSGVGRIALGPDVPEPGVSTAGIELDLVVGYGTDPERVPMPMRQALRQLVAGWYERRGDTAAAATLPDEVAALLAPYRPVRL
ncbi:MULTISPECIES: head-tail connector protein [unclassified Chelatococcus]|uniref:head-tail connector protein n=1 Tax=unclassified Chelatococcus TaxID=2638111 RepID=UPI001BCAB744|nr:MULTISPECIES: head-tail connector protein [unclassified Chelatococcus]MBS7698458.1 head-tail connector protein [Chelatococcus sp. YT9]MBX3559464.1 head-tail connector protein [Chelatococcus sp.]